ncbi:hypothetical protein, partial [Acinetobacter baumannii]|uniref:hypothetical protein n=1 Tax=Acinetobacter baumannii TaxID=470 RepID=UPI0033987067
MYHANLLRRYIEREEEVSAEEEEGNDSSEEQRVDNVAVVIDETEVELESEQVPTCILTAKESHVHVNINPGLEPDKKKEL